MSRFQGSGLLDGAKESSDLKNSSDFRQCDKSLVTPQVCQVRAFSRHAAPSSKPLPTSSRVAQCSVLGILGFIEHRNLQRRTADTLEPKSTQLEMWELLQLRSSTAVNCTRVFQKASSGFQTKLRFTFF